MVARRACMAAGILVALAYGAVASAAGGFEDVRERLCSAARDARVPSIAVAIFQDGRILFEGGCGWADREKQITATAHTRYAIASVSKPLTATGLMTLVQAGRIDLDRPVNDYLGGALLRARIGDVRQATVRRIADHTSGLPLHWQFFYADQPFAVPPFEETLQRYGNLVSIPGERFSYSNLNYGILGSVVERVAGEPFWKFMRAQVFLPLGMTNTSVGIEHAPPGETAILYGKDGRPLPRHRSNHPGASDVYSSVHDLALFGLFHLGAHRRGQVPILDDSHLEEMHRQTAQNGDRGFGYGIGFEVSTFRGHRMVHHSGGMDGASSNLLLFPQQGLGIVALANARPAPLDTVTNAILAELLTGWKEAADEPAAPTPAFSPSAELLGKWRGTLSTYARDLPMSLEFVAGGAVRARLGDQSWVAVEGMTFNDGLFKAELTARIGTPDVERDRYRLLLSLQLRGTALTGGATALDEGPRARSALTHWVELGKEGG